MSTSLRILVPVKRVIDYAIRPRVNPTKTAIITAGVKHSLNPFDELSIEAAVRLRESPSPPSPPVSDILALSIGGLKCADTLRTAMAMGADRSIHVLVEAEESNKEKGREGGAELEPLGVAKVLKEVVEREKSNLVILGKQSIDGDNGQTGQMLAGLLGWGQATQASKIDIVAGTGGGEGEEEGDVKVEVTCEVDGGVETVRGRLPMVITTDLRLNEPRYASLPNIMKAKKKPLEKMNLADFKGVPEVGKRRLKTLKVEEPPPRQGGGKVADVDGMIAKLKELGAI